MEHVDGSENDHQKKKKARRRRRKSTSDAEHEVAVGSDAGDAEEMECHAYDHPDDDEDSFYEPDIGEEVRDVDQGVEVEEIGEVVGEDDDDVLDVDEEDGGVRLSKRGTLKNEARSKNHLLTHRYKNPFRESCVRAKMKHRKTFRGAFQKSWRSLATWSLLTMSAIDVFLSKTMERTRRYSSFEIGTLASVKLTHQLERIPMLLSEQSSSSWEEERFVKLIPMKLQSSKRPCRH